MTDEPDHVLVALKKTHNRKTMHEPDPDNPDRPKCDHPGRRNVNWVRKDPDAPPTYQECQLCNGTAQKANKGPELAAKLSKMDPEVV